jgi:hypothetical protein
MTHKNAQVTVFMILGLVILAGAVMLFIVSATLRTSQLSTASEDVITTVFEKEGLRFYVESCLLDGLESGLRKIGTQGRLWLDDDEGGTLAFSEGINGITITDDGEEIPVYYAIIKTSDMYENSYPCVDQKQDTPSFCTYRYEDLGQRAAFGKTKLVGSQIERDLEGYLKKKTTDCVTELISQDLSITSSIRQDELEIGVDLESQGFVVHARYPLELHVDSSTYFHLTDFDFFYPSEFRSFLRSALSTPLRNEAQKVDYAFSIDELEATDTYRDLSAEFSERVHGADRVIEYSLAAPKILQSGDPYIFRFAIQNRAPALDYLDNVACTTFDYLVIPGDDSMGILEILAEAHDPDGDDIDYEFDYTSLGSDPDIPTSSDNSLSFTPGEGFEPGTYQITVTSRDAFGNKDWQDVEVLIDTPKEMSIVLQNPYYDSEELSPGEIFVTSIEDPIFVHLTFPEPSVVEGNVEEKLQFEYNNNVEGDNSEVIPPTEINIGLGPEYCISLPNKEYTPIDPDVYECNDVRYEDKIGEWGSFVSALDNKQFSKTTGESYGTLSLQFDSTYCTNYLHDPIKVQKCIDNSDPDNEYPFAYPYHNVKVHANGVHTEEEGANPYTSVNSCCTTGGEYKDEENECYSSAPDCYGNILDWTTNNLGYIVEIEKDFCTGERGNMCGDGNRLPTSELFEGDVVCGDPTTMNECSNEIDSNCYGAHAWGKSITGGGWCHGRMGCSEFCSLGIIYSGAEYTSTSLPPPYSEFGEIAYARSITTDAEFDFSCSTCGVNDGALCDSDVDGEWGVCSGGSCDD